MNSSSCGENPAMGPTIIIIIIVFIIIIYYYILYIISYLIIHYIIYIISYIIIVIIHYCHNIYKLRQINLFLIPYFSQETRGIMHSIIEKKQYLHLPLRIVGKYFIVIEFEFHFAKIQLSDCKHLQKFSRGLFVAVFADFSLFCEI